MSSMTKLLYILLKFRASVSFLFKPRRGKVKDFIRGLIVDTFGVVDDVTQFGVGDDVASVGRPARLQHLFVGLLVRRGVHDLPKQVEHLNNKTGLKIKTDLKR